MNYKHKTNGAVVLESDLQRIRPEFHKEFEETDEPHTHSAYGDGENLFPLEATGTTESSNPAAPSNTSIKDAVKKAAKKSTGKK